jgi:curved DNA-binding protein CbpA
MMLLKKSPAALSSSYGALPVLCSQPSTTSPCRPWDRRNALSPPCAQQRRSYASVRDGAPHQQGKDNPNDQSGWPTSANPTPYEILGLAKDAPYSKARFFQLAKLYHPDRHQQTSDDGISHLTKLDRYRLVVAANEIISNKQKRRMYDTYGVGWGNQTDQLARHRAADKEWRKDPGNASMNATWEDWERWQQKRNGGGQEGLSTGGFAAISALFLVVATWGWATRAGTDSINLMEIRDQRHAEISKELRKRQSETVSLNREGRVDSFLRHRELEKAAYDPPAHGVSGNTGMSIRETRPHG